jgi:voltage-gated potassium channel
MKILGVAIKASLIKISIFMLVLLTLVIVLRSVMYLIEECQNAFSGIPKSIYWAIVTITTR